MYHRIADLFTGRFVTHRAVLISLFIFALLSVIWAAMPFFSLLVDYAPEPYGLTCTLDFVKMDIRYLISIFTGVYLVPVTLMTFCYLSIVKTLRTAIMRSHFTHKRRLDIRLTKVRYFNYICISNTIPLHTAHYSEVNSYVMLIT